MTQRTEDSFELEAHAWRQVVARFDGEAVTSDAGALLLREAERRIGLLDRVTACFDDWRDGRNVRHSLSERVAQRVYGLALGYEDVNDHEPLREDALFGLLAGRREAGRAPLAPHVHAEPAGAGRGAGRPRLQDSLPAGAVRCAAGGALSGGAGAGDAGRGRDRSAAARAAGGAVLSRVLR